MDAIEVIRDLSIHLEAGKTYCIVGRSGSGKSTLNKLVQELYIPNANMVQTIHATKVTSAHNFIL